MRRLLIGLLLAVSAPLDAVSLNSRGQVALGLADGVVSIDGREIARGGGVAWKTDDVLAFQIADRWVIVEYDQRTGQITEVAPRGGNTLYAGGGIWASWLAGFGVYTSTNLHWPSDGLLGVGPDGAIAYGPMTGLGATVREASGAEWALSAGVVSDLDLLGQGRAIWREGVGIQVRGLPEPVRLSGALWGPKAVELQGTWWLLYTSDGRGLVLHPFDSLQGYVLNATPDAFAPDLIALSGTTVRVAWAAREGEHPSDLRVRDLDVSAVPRMDLRVSVPDTPPPPPPPPPFDCGTLPERGQTLLRQLAAKFSSEIRSPDDDQRRAWALKAAQQMAFSLDPDWGSKRADPGRPQTKDGIARIVDGRLCGWDLVNGTTRELQFGGGEDISGQVFIAVTPTDHLGSTPPPPPSDSALKQRIAELETDVANLLEAVDSVERERDAARIRANELEAERDRLQRELDALAQQPPPRCEAKLWGLISVPCKVIR